MTVIFGTLKDVGGQLAQGTVTVASLVTRPAHGAASTVITKERHVLPLRNGEFVSPDLDPGPVLIEAASGGAFESWEVTLPEDGRHDLATLIEMHVEYAPSVVGRVEAAAADANRSAQAAGQSATRAGEAEQRIIAVESRVDGIVEDGAAAVRAALAADIESVDEGKSAAVAARDGAVAARADAVSARGAAELARDAAVSARSAAELARDGAVDAADRAEGAAAGVAEDAAAAVDAAGRAEVAADAADASAAGAAESAGAAASSESAAAASAAEAQTIVDGIPLIQGPKGDKGDPGDRGEAGPPGTTVWSGITSRPMSAARITPDVDVVLDAPPPVSDGHMHIWEVRPTNGVTVQLPAGSRRIDGINATVDTLAGDVLWVGARWSAASSSWTVLSQAMEVPL